MSQLFETLSDFLNQTGSEFRVYDMGRRITRISADDFLRFENAQIPYPYPFVQAAWLGITFWNREKDKEPQVWFLKFPLDEQGKLLQAGRDDFLSRILEAANDKLSAEDRKEADSALKDNPFGFTPNQEKMASFHAKMTKEMGLPASKYYEHAQSYFAGEPGFDQWNFLGYQGIADVVARLSEKDNEAALASAIPQLPTEPFEALCNCLENQVTTITLAEPLAEKLRHDLPLTETDPNTVAANLRALAQSKATGLKEQLVQEVLLSDYGSDVEVISAISGRLWEVLLNESILMSFLEALANNRYGQQSFNAVLVDLLYIPGMREPVMQAMRNPERSNKLAEAIGELFKLFNASAE